MNTVQKFEVRVWEKAEHWYFYSTVEAKDERDAWVQARKEWPKKEYRISDVRPSN
jgi:hypothetical protein